MPGLIDSLAKALGYVKRPDAPNLPDMTGSALSLPELSEVEASDVPSEPPQLNQSPPPIPNIDANTLPLAEMANNGQFTPEEFRNIYAKSLSGEPLEAAPEKPIAEDSGVMKFLKGASGGLGNAMARSALGPDIGDAVSMATGGNVNLMPSRKPEDLMQADFNAMTPAQQEFVTKNFGSIAGLKQSSQRTQKDIFEGSEAFRREMKNDPRLKDLFVATDYYNNLKEMEKNPSVASPLSMLYVYSKIMDPGGRVTASDIQAGQNLGNLDEKVQAWVQNWLGNGKAMTPNQMKALASEIENAYTARRSASEPILQDYSKKAILSGYDPKIALAEVFSPEPSGWHPKGGAREKAPEKPNNDELKAYKAALYQLANGKSTSNTRNYIGKFEETYGTGYQRSK